MAAKLVIKPEHTAIAHSFIIDPVLLAAIIEQEPEVPDLNTVTTMCRRLVMCLDANLGDEAEALAIYNPRGQSDFVSKVLQAKRKYY